MLVSCIRFLRERARYTSTIYGVDNGRSFVGGSSGGSSLCYAWVVDGSGYATLDRESSYTLATMGNMTVEATVSTIKRCSCETDLVLVSVQADFYSPSTSTLDVQSLIRLIHLSIAPTYSKHN